ncbi:alpha/beta fold hydrolase [Mastigocladopsis repens]|uniref:alpha/beta fold hydrolase n=1 Tax=Mastigocladopsis repens TaxID=221287 RepID=UPI00031CF254|nr:alpha/beta fold hydrolase [Mastigocladopsis repens]
MKRRGFLLGSALALSTSVAFGQYRVGLTSPNNPARNSKVILLIHGAWHSAQHWKKVSELLTQMGHRVVAMDLPGHGLEAKFPTSYLRQDLAMLATEESPLKALTIKDYVDAAVEEVRALSTDQKVIVVGHSMGGIVVTQLGEKVPDRIERLVYLTAYCHTKLPDLLAYNNLPQAAVAQSRQRDAIIGNPTKIGAVRLNMRSIDPNYLEKLRQIFYNDITMENFLPYAHSLTPDLPLGPVTADTRGTSARWGRVPRTFIRCTNDRAIPLALQDLMIEQADELTPSNKFHLQTLNSSHSPFASQPKLLSDILDRLP